MQMETRIADDNGATAFAEIVPANNTDHTNNAIQPNPAGSGAEVGSELSRLNHAMGPVAAGLIIDAVDLVTFGPVGLVFGLPVGAAAGFWLGQSMGLQTGACVICGIAAGIYCTIPGTELLPLGTLVGALYRYQNHEPVIAGTPAESSDSAAAES